MHGGRNFKAASGIGGGTQQGADIVVFGRKSSAVVNQILSKLKARSVGVKLMNGTEVLIFDRKESGEQMLTFVCSPCESVLITATSEGFLQEMLDRLQQGPRVSALPAVLPEWHYVDTSAACWAIRHYDRSNAPFDRSAPHTPVMPENSHSASEYGATFYGDETGFVFSGDKAGYACFKFLATNAKKSKERAESWRQYLIQEGNGFQPQEKGGGGIPLLPLTVKVASDQMTAILEGKTNARSTPILGLLLMDALGYLTNI